MDNLLGLSNTHKQNIQSICYQHGQTQMVALVRTKLDQQKFYILFHIN